MMLNRIVSRPGMTPLLQGVRNNELRNFASNFSKAKFHDLCKKSTGKGISFLRIPQLKGISTNSINSKEFGNSFVSSNDRKPFSILSGIWRKPPNSLQIDADSKPADAEVQEMYLKSLLVPNPEEVMKRFESGVFAMNENSKTIYFSAAYNLNKLDKAIQFTNSNNGGSPPIPTANPFHNNGNQGPVQVRLVSSRSERMISIIQILATLAVPTSIFLFLYFSYGEESKDSQAVSRAHSLAENIDVRFNDVKGVDEAKSELEEVVEYLKNPEKFTKLGAKLPKGVLLVGEPGTGKTLLARAVAGEAGVRFLYVSGSAFDEMFVGVGPKRVRDLFEDARRMAPCIIFIDELDAVGVARKYNMSGSYAKESTLNQLLTEMDGFKQTAGIMVIAATNLPETLDSALTRPGRFDKQVTVPTPDIVGRKEILDLYLKKTKPASDVNSETIARGTTGFSGAELSNLINLAAIKAAIAGASQVDMKTIEEARDDIIMGGKKRGVVQTEEDKKLTAYHEGGHALVALYSEGALPIHKATIIQRGNALGTTSFLPERDEVSISRKQMISRLKVAMGGRAAEELVFGEDGITTGASSDFATATNLARNMVSKLGFSEKIGTVYHDSKSRVSEHQLEVIDDEVKILIQNSYNDAKRILKEHEKELHLLAKSLLENETLSAEEIKLVIAGKELNKLANILKESDSGKQQEPEKQKEPEVKTTPIRTKGVRVAQ